EDIHGEPVRAGWERSCAGLFPDGSYRKVQRKQICAAAKIDISRPDFFPLPYFRGGSVRDGLGPIRFGRRRAPPLVGPESLGTRAGFGRCFVLARGGWPVDLVALFAVRTFHLGF